MRYNKTPSGRLLAGGSVVVAMALLSLGVSIAGAAPGTRGSQTANAMAATAQALRAPTRIGLRTELRAVPPKGKTIVFLECSDIPQCAEFLPGVQKGAAALGWKVKVLSFTTANPSSLISAMQQALQYKPVAVSMSGMSESIWGSEVPAYKKAGVAIIPMVAGPISVNPTVPVGLMTPGDEMAAGRIIGNWFIQDSQAAGHALMVDVPTFAVLKEYTDGVVSQIKSHCTMCVVTSMDASLSEVGSNGVVPAVVAAIQANPSIKYVLFSDGAFDTGLTAALKTIGRTDVKIAGGSPSIQDEQALITGQESAWTGQAYSYIGWMFVDAAARLVEKLPIPVGDGGVPQQLLMASNVGKPSNDLIEPSNYPSLFKKLWRVK